MNVDFQEQDIIIEFTPEGQDGKSIRPRGDWSATAQYVELDLVSYQGSTYIAQKIVPVGTLPTDTEYWMINASNETPYWGTIAGTLSDQTDLQTALNEKADSADVYTKTETDNLLNAKADADSVYTKTETDDLLAAKADADDVYTKTEADNLFSEKADADDVYTKTETDTLLSAKADASAVYTTSEVDTLLSAKADADDVYTKSQTYSKTEVDNALSTKANAADVYTKTQADDLLSAKANTADLGALADQDTVNYETEVTNKPDFGDMAFEDDAPSDGKTYGRKNGDWSEITSGGGTWGQITGTLSDQTDLANALLDKAPVILSNASGSIASFADGSPAPVTALSVGIEPVQDLHGYSNPWPAGGGANKFDGDVTTGRINTGTGVPNGTTPGKRTTNYIPVTPSTSYYIYSGGNINVFILEYDADKTFLRYVDYYKNAVYTSSNDAYYVMFYTTVDTDYDKISFNYPSTVTTYQPYSNVCPISGHTQTVVTRTGKNLFCTTATSNTLNGTTFTVNNDGSITVSGTPSAAIGSYVFGRMTLKPGNYKVNGFSSGSSSNIRLLFNNTTESIIMLIYQGIDGSFVVSKESEVIVYPLVPTTYDGTTVTFYPMIRPASVDDASFEPYQGTSVTIDLDGTRYGGVLDVLTGVLTVTMASATLNSTKIVRDNGTRYHVKKSDIGDISSVATSPALMNKFRRLQSGEVTSTPSRFFFDTTYLQMNAYQSFATKQEFFDAYGEIQLVYTLGTPLSIQLTANQISTLLGQNAIWSDTGNTSVEYRADTRLFVEGQIAQTAKVTRQMIADTANGNLAPKSLASGDLIIVGDELRKCTANIGNGSAITDNNSTVATLADVIKALQ